MAGLRFKWSFFRSKLARRIFLMFVACSLLPIAALSVLSFRQVTRQLDFQSRNHLVRSAKTHISMIGERLLFLETDLKIVISMLQDSSELQLASDHLKRLERRFKGIALLAPDGLIKTVSGAEIEPPGLNDAEWSHIRAGSTVIKSQPATDGWPRLLMIRLIKPTHLTSFPVVAEIDPSFLWTTRDQNELRSDLDFCVFSAHNNLLFSTFDISPSLAPKLGTLSANGHSRLTRIELENETLQICRWPLVLKSGFSGPRWTIMVVQAESTLLWPIAQFRYMLILVTLTTFLVVLLLSIKMIQRSLTPLERLKESTRRIARKDFSGHLDIRSGDEFEELAEAFNNMSEQLNRQFKTLLAKSEIDRAILSSIETEKIVRAVLTGMRACFYYDAISIVLLDGGSDGQARIYTGSGTHDDTIQTTPAHIPEIDLAPLCDRPEHFFIGPDQPLPSYLVPVKADAEATYLVLPIFLKQKPAALIAFGFHRERAYDQEDIRLARQMADQVAVALANSQLMDELNRLNWGTIMALARTVDAKSSWTAGHSERVAAMAVSIGTTMHLPHSELEDLKRAALLHDIGKLGVPVAVLDKPGKLTPEEYRVVQRHPSLGASILQPINAFADIIPMVRHHHENFDGSGYPDGLAGSEIEIGARILAVADVFDALKSDRPYRRGLPSSQVIDFMRKETGQKFDPQVVKALIVNLKPDGNGIESKSAALSSNRRQFGSGPKRSGANQPPPRATSTP